MIDAMFNNTMPVTPTDMLGATGGIDRAPDQDAIFSQMLTDRMGHRVDGDPVRDAAKELVAFGLIMPMLQQMQDDPFRSELFHGGQGEKMFNAQLNQHLAKRIVGRMNMPLVDAVYQQINRAGGKGGV